ncbi:DMT family transporter [Pseudomonas sp. 5P_3.1_Bac2]|uniref:DMT family transporter n=1 Tax=Pseudomonas sp. 5P_3.1_Bac2 TaxID=2971617 RepID=UPI0021C9EBB2|nr:DMT family transporter [Pseudomonas sp. 5P_3.1_Bac2]MCU1718264.1 DMT family transporter [Pseudomonas sp. 5P_3.1_Bac2]
MLNTNHLGLGLSLILASCLLLAGSDALSKYLLQSYPVLLVVWLRYVLQTMLMLGLFAPRMGRRLIQTQRPLLQLARSMSLVGTSAFMFTSLLFIPLGETTAVLFLAPMVVLLASVALFKEPVSRGQWLSVGLGLIGVVIIVRPGGGLFTPYVLLPIGAALCLGFYQLLTRRLANTDHPLTSNFFSTLFGTLVMSLSLPWVWQMPVAQDLWVALLIAVLAISGHLLLSNAYRFASAAALAPFTYAQIIFAVLFGALFFAHVPDHGALLGMAIIILSGLLVAWNKRRPGIS